MPSISSSTTMKIDSASESLPSDDVEKTGCKKTVISLVVVAAVAAAWALSTQFSKSALIVNKEHFFAPYFMMWFSTTFMTTCFPVFLIYTKVSGKNVPAAIREAQLIFGNNGLCARSIAIYVLPFLVMWTVGVVIVGGAYVVRLGANYSYSRALGSISASVATSISSCNAAIVYLLAILLLGDRFQPFKLLAVLFAIGGVVVMSLDSEMTAHWWGLLLAILSACFAAAYKVCFKKVIGDASLGQVSLFMTCLGLCNLVINAFPAWGLIIGKVEPWEFQYVPWGPLIGSACLSLLFNFLINFGIALLNPLVISIGMLIGLPLNTAIDVVYRGLSASGYFLGGTALIVVSFFLIIFPYDLVMSKIRGARRTAPGVV